MRVDLSRLITTAVMGTAILVSSSTSARAALTLQVSSGSYSEQVSDTTSSGSILYSNTSYDGGIFAIYGLLARSNSTTDGPSNISQMSIASFTLQNTSSSAQTLTISLSDTGFDPDNAIRPLLVYNSASATFGQLTPGSGTLTFQTYAYDGTALFQTGAGTVSPDPVVLTPTSNGYTTTAPFTPVNAQFSLTSVMTIELAAGASITGSTGLALVHAPEPGTAVLAFSGSLPLAIGLWLRRRRRLAA
jgi:hypothetical protein